MFRATSDPEVAAYLPAFAGKAPSELRFSIQSVAGRTNSGDKFLAGGIAGCAAKTITAPLSRYTVLAQTFTILATTETAAVHGTQLGGSWTLRAWMREVHKSEGVFGWWKGNTCTILHRFPYTALNFVVNDWCVSFLGRCGYSQRTVFGCLAPGAVAGMAAVIACYPLELARTRLMVDSSINGMYTKEGVYVNSIWRCLKDIKGTGGFAALYRGVFLSMMVQVPAVSASFGIYSLLREHSLLQWMGPSAASIVSGGLSGVGGSLLSFPIDLLRRREQVRGMSMPSADRKSVHKETIEDLKRVVRSEGGYLGCYRGFTIEACKIFPSVGITFFVYETVLSFTAR